MDTTKPFGAGDLKKHSLESEGTASPDRPGPDVAIAGSSATINEGVCVCVLVSRSLRLEFSTGTTVATIELAPSTG